MKNLKWIYYITKRFSRVDGKTRSAVTSVMPALGIGFGVMALIVVMAVMNGFQRGSIDALLEISSYHIRVTPSDIFNKEIFLTNAKDVNNVKSVYPFYEAQGLVVGRHGSQSAALFRAVPDNIKEIDSGLSKSNAIKRFSFTSPTLNELPLVIAFAIFDNVLMLIIILSLFN